MPMIDLETQQRMVINTNLITGIKAVKGHRDHYRVEYSVLNRVLGTVGLPPVPPRLIRKRWVRAKVVIWVSGSDEPYRILCKSNRAADQLMESMLEKIRGTEDG